MSRCARSVRYLAIWRNPWSRRGSWSSWQAGAPRGIWSSDPRSCERAVRMVLEIWAGRAKDTVSWPGWAVNLMFALRRDVLNWRSDPSFGRLCPLIGRSECWPYVGQDAWRPTDHSFGAARVPTEATSLPTISAVHGRHRNGAPTGDGRLSGPEAPPGSSGARRA
jgi:hypothetical protein